MTESDSRPLNAGVPAVETVRRLLAEAEKASRELDRQADEMVARAEAGRRDARSLIAALGEARKELAGEGLGEALVDDDAPEEAEVREEPEAAPDRGTDGARMLARQMLANGADRTVVARSLRTSFGVQNADAVVDSIAGGD